MKTHFFEKNGIVVLYALQVCFILLAIMEAICHRWLGGIVSNLVMVLAVAVFIIHVRMSIRRKGTMDLVASIAHS